MHVTRIIPCVFFGEAVFLYHPKYRKYLHSEVFMLRMTFHYIP
jgi:hypothetical protein